jgi:hypothetical protein
MWYLNPIIHYRVDKSLSLDSFLGYFNLLDTHPVYFRPSYPRGTGVVSSELRRPGCEANPLHRLPRIRMRGATCTPPYVLMALCLVKHQGQLYLLLYDFNIILQFWRRSSRLSSALKFSNFYVLYAFIISPLCVLCSARLNTLDLITKIIFGEECNCNAYDSALLKEVLWRTMWTQVRTVQWYTKWCVLGCWTTFQCAATWKG